MVEFVTKTACFLVVCVRLCKWMAAVCIEACIYCVICWMFVHEAWMSTIHYFAILYSFRYVFYFWSCSFIGPAFVARWHKRKRASLIWWKSACSASSKLHCCRMHVIVNYFRLAVSTTYSAASTEKQVSKAI